MRIHNTSDKSWLIGGDFNSVLHLNERIGSAVTLVEVANFRECIRFTHLHEASCSGPFFTWSSKQGRDDRVFIKINRVCMNDEWDDTFPQYNVQFLPESIFDHCPCVVTLDSKVSTKPQPFRFYNMWGMAQEFGSIMANGWQRSVQGVPMHRVVTKLKGLKLMLKNLNISKFSNIENVTDEAHNVLTGLQGQIYNDPGNVDLLGREKEAREKYEEMNKSRMSFLRQKMMQDWLKGGDTNITYFHACLKKRRAHNQIHGIQNTRGEWVDTQESLENAFLQFYESLTWTTQIDRRKVSRTIVNEGQVLNEEHQSSLSMQFNVEDVREAIFYIEDDKFPSPDGYSSFFFKKSWHLVGEEVTGVVLDYFQTGRMLKQINATTLCLIPKCEQPLNVSQFRPIACCTVLYKVISKMLCKRLKKVLPFLVNPMQGAFIEDRVIWHKFFLYRVILKHYKRKS